MRSKTFKVGKLGSFKVGRAGKSQAYIVVSDWMFEHSRSKIRLHPKKLYDIAATCIQIADEIEVRMKP